MKTLPTIENYAQLATAYAQVTLAGDRQLARQLREETLAIGLRLGIREDLAPELRGLRDAASEAATRRYHALWSRIHTNALLTDDASWNRAQQWLTGRLPKLLKCAICRSHYEEWLAEHPPQRDSDGSWHTWAVELHNHVNRITGKPVWTLEDARHRWSSRK